MSGLIEKVRRLLHTRLYTSAIFLVIIRATDAILGFVFWLVVTRLYTPADIGIAYAIFSAVGLITAFAHLGLGNGLIRFFPTTPQDRSDTINTVLTVGAATSLAGALIFLAGLGFWSPAMIFLRQNWLYFAGFCLLAVAGNVTFLNDQTFIASRQPRYATVKSLVFNGSRVLLPIPLSFVLSRSLGIVMAWSISLAIAVVIGLLPLMRRVEPAYLPRLTVNRAALAKIFRFSFLTFFSTVFWGLPNWILPIMVVNRIGADANAYFAIAWTIGTTVGAIPSAVSTSLLAEGSYKTSDLGLNIKRSLVFSYAILIPAVAVLVPVAGYVLRLFGHTYATDSVSAIRIILLANIPLTVNSMFMSTKMVQMKLREVMLAAVWVGAVAIGMGFALAPRMGIDGVGIAWLAAHGSLAVYTSISLFRGARKERVNTSPAAD